MDSAPRHSRLLWVAVLIVFCATAASVRVLSFRAGVPVGQVNTDAIAEASGLADEAKSPRPSFVVLLVDDQGGAPSAAIRLGDWKLIEWFENGKLELFNLREDVGERQDLAGAVPERARMLRDKLQAWQKEVGALKPSRNPQLTPTAAKWSAAILPALQPG